MKEILYMYMPGCPFCAQADRLLAGLREQNPAYEAIPVRKVDETRERRFADSLDYWFVPCMFVDGVKLLEGVPDENAVRLVLDTALQK